MGSTDKDPLGEYPQKAEGTFGYEVARTTIDAAASFIPGASYAVGSLVQKFVSAPLEKRRDEWFQRVGEGLMKLEEKLSDFDPRKLDENDDFITAVFTATQEAMRTAHEEKRLALRNGILNSALDPSLDETLIGSFISYVSQFSPGHLAILNLLAAPHTSPAMVAKAKNVAVGSQKSILEAALPQFRPVLPRILADLEREGLAETSGMMAMGSAGSLLSKRTTPYGERFLAFVRSPVDE